MFSEKESLSMQFKAGKNKVSNQLKAKRSVEKGKKRGGANRMFLNDLCKTMEASSRQSSDLLSPAFNLTYPHARKVNWTTSSKELKWLNLHQLSQVYFGIRC